MLNIGQFFKRLFTPKTTEEKAKSFVDNLVVEHLPVADKYIVWFYENSQLDTTSKEFDTLSQVQFWIKREVEWRYGVGVQKIKL